MEEHEQGKLVCCALVPAFCVLQLEAGGSWPEGPVPCLRHLPRGVRGQTKRTGIALACLFGRHQYSDGRRIVVELRSASVMIQSLVPLERAYEDSSRKPCATDSSFSRRSSSSSSPQSPVTWRLRKLPGFSAASSNAPRAPGVATTRPSGPLVPEIPCGRVCRSLSASMLRYLAGSRGRSTARSPSPGIGPSKRILYSARRLDSAPHISETRTLAGDP